MRTMMPRTTTCCRVGSVLMVRRMSAATSSSRPRMIARPSRFRKLRKTSFRSAGPVPHSRPERDEGAD